MQPVWRRIQNNERFIYGDFEGTPITRGYIAETFVLLHNHQTCNCTLSTTPVRIQWFLPHNIEQHGRFPMPYTKEQEISDQLKREKPWLDIGFCVRLSPMISYGHLTFDWSVLKKQENKTLWAQNRTWHHERELNIKPSFELHCRTWNKQLKSFKQNKDHLLTFKLCSDKRSRRHCSPTTVNSNLAKPFQITSDRILSPKKKIHSTLNKN